jgi:hypothetical protein
MICKRKDKAGGCVCSIPRPHLCQEALEKLDNLAGRGLSEEGNKKAQDQVKKTRHFFTSLL